MVEIRKTIPDELDLIVALEQQPDTRTFIIPYTREKHKANFDDPNRVYLTIVQEGTFVGFLLLVLERESNSVECRRIVVGSKGQGIGQRALQLMEDYCKTEFDCERIWLDVFAFNERGRHVYEKLGYVVFDQTEYEGKPLILLEKVFSAH